MAEVIGNVDELVALIHRAAQQAALDIEAEARQAAQRTHDDAQMRREQMRAETMDRARRQAEETQRQTGAQAALDGQHRRLLAREALLEKAWAEAEKRLRMLTGEPRYVDILACLALFGARQLDAQTVLLAADPTGHALLRPERLAAWSQTAGVTFVRAPAAITAWGGLTVSDVQGRSQIDCTFATRLAQAHAELREQLAERLGVT